MAQLHVFTISRKESTQAKSSQHESSVLNKAIRVGMVIFVFDTHHANNIPTDSPLNAKRLHTRPQAPPPNAKTRSTACTVRPRASRPRRPPLAFEHGAPPRVQRLSHRTCRAIPKVIVHRLDHLPSRVIIRGLQRSSDVIRGHQRSSEVIRGPQSSSCTILASFGRLRPAHCATRHAAR